MAFWAPIMSAFGGGGAAAGGAAAGGGMMGGGGGAMGAANFSRIGGIGAGQGGGQAPPQGGGGGGGGGGGLLSGLGAGAKISAAGRALGGIADALDQRLTDVQVPNRSVAPGAPIMNQGTVGLQELLSGISGRGY